MVCFSILGSGILLEGQTALLAIGKHGLLLSIVVKIHAKVYSCHLNNMTKQTSIDTPKFATKLTSNTLNSCSALSFTASFALSSPSPNDKSSCSNFWCTKENIEQRLSGQAGNHPAPFADNFCWCSSSISRPFNIVFVSH